MPIVLISCVSRFRVLLFLDFITNPGRGLDPLLLFVTSGFFRISVVVDLFILTTHFRTTASPCLISKSK